jgi:hypothetical protein
MLEPRRPDPIRRDKNNQPLTNNPRDNLVSMIAITTGEEAFEDLNNNGVRDENPLEPFEDLTEPFVDNNDNGTWDPKERFVDANGNGKWDGKNGKFDSITLIWVQERILWTGIPHALDRKDATNAPAIIRQVDPIPPAGADVVTLNIPHKGAKSSSFVYADPWFNGMARNSTGDGCEGGEAGSVEVKSLTKGRHFTSRSVNLETYVIKDPHQPTDPPQLTSYTVDPVCRMTASQEGGHEAIIIAPRVQGSVDAP